MLGLVEKAGVQDVRAHLQLPGDLTGDDGLVARDHLDADAHLLSGLDGRLGILARRIVERKDAQELPVAVVVGPRDAQGTETPGGELADCPGDLRANLVLVGGQIEDDLRRALRDLELTPVRSSNLGLRALWIGSNGWKWSTS